MPVAGAADVDEKQLQVIAPFPEGSKPLNLLARRAKSLRRASGRHLDLRFVASKPEAAMSVLQRLRSDSSLSAGLVSGFEYANLVPDANLYSQAFAFDNAQQVDFVRSQLDAVLLENLQHEEFVALGISGVGFAYLMSQDPIVQGFASNFDIDEPGFSRHSTLEFILDKNMPRPAYLLRPPMHYGYLLFVVKRAAWQSLSSADQALLWAHIQSLLEDLEKRARKAGERATKVLLKGDIQSDTLSDADLAVMRHSGTCDDISPALQSGFRGMLEDYRRTLSESKP